MDPERQTDLLNRTVESLRGELLTVYEELALLHCLGAKLGRLAGEDEVARAALYEALDITRSGCGWVALWEAETFRVACHERIPIEAAEAISRRALETLYFKRKSHFLSNAFRPECGIDLANIPDRVLATALPAGEGSFGFLCLGRDATGRIFTAADQKLLTAIASLTAAQIENVRLRQSEVEKARLESELELAREVQRALAPSDFAFCDYLDADGASVPCQQIAGDYFDLLPLDDNQCLLVVADVSGKGPAAALQAAMLQGIVHAAIRHTLELPQLMVTIHECLRRRSVMGAYATVFLGILERSGRLRYSNGGHNAPLWIRSGSRVAQLTEGGPLLGMLEGAAYREGVVQLEAGDLVLLYTDGVTEAQNPEGESWGLPRLLDWAQRQPGRPAAEVHQGLLRSVTQFCRGHAQGDDLTTLVVRYRG